MRALHTAATGMMAQELNVQVISNNIANMRTTGYKRQRAEFQDLLYEYVSRVGTQTSAQGNILPAGIELGSGVKTAGTPRLMSQGELTQTGKDFDLAIRGACEAALAQRLGQLLDAGLLPEPALLEAEFAPREPSAPEVSVQLPALTSFDALLGGEVCA